MAKKKEDFKGKSAAELETVVLDGRKELFNLRFQKATGELANTARISEVRKNVARANTLKNQLAKKAGA